MRKKTGRFRIFTTDSVARMRFCGGFECAPKGAAFECAPKARALATYNIFPNQRKRSPKPPWFLRLLLRRPAISIFRARLRSVRMNWDAAVSVCGSPSVLFGTSGCDMPKPFEGEPSDVDCRAKNEVRTYGVRARLRELLVL